MEGMHIDVTEVAAIWMGGLLLLVPLLGLTLRFAVKPLLDSVARLREAGAAAASEAISELDLRLALVEQQIQPPVAAAENGSFESVSAPLRVAVGR